MNLPEQIGALTAALDAARIPHAFGGAIALAFCVPEPRATADLDVNIFLPASQAPRALDALPEQVDRGDGALATIERDGQVRLWWNRTPLDLFFNTTAFHEQAALRARPVAFGPISIPVLACRDLAVFKAFFDRGKDWVDLQSMADGEVLDVAAVVGVLSEYLGIEDHRIGKLLALSNHPQ